MSYEESKELYVVYDTRRLVSILTLSYLEQREEERKVYYSNAIQHYSRITWPLCLFQNESKHTERQDGSLLPGLQLCSVIHAGSSRVIDLQLICFLQTRLLVLITILYVTGKLHQTETTESRPG